jgi:hypothetical protein
MVTIPESHRDLPDYPSSSQRINLAGGMSVHLGPLARGGWKQSYAAATGSALRIGAHSVWCDRERR